MKAMSSARLRGGSSLRGKLLLASVACLLIPTLITLTVSNALTRNAVREQAATNAAKQLEIGRAHV